MHTLTQILLLEGCLAWQLPEGGTSEAAPRRLSNGGGACGGTCSVGGDNWYGICDCDGGAGSSCDCDYGMCGQKQCGIGGDSQGECNCDGGYGSSCDCDGGFCSGQCARGGDNPGAVCNCDGGAHRSCDCDYGMCSGSCKAGGDNPNGECDCDGGAGISCDCDAGYSALVQGDCSAMPTYCDSCRSYAYCLSTPDANCVNAPEYCGRETRPRARSGFRTDASVCSVLCCVPAVS